MSGKVHPVLVALHDLTVSIAPAQGPEALAAALLRAFEAAAFDAQVAIWWQRETAMERLAGSREAPESLPAVAPPDLCVIHHGRAYDDALFPETSSPGWLYVPITDRKHLYGWIGTLPGAAPDDLLLAFACAAGGIVGKSWQLYLSEQARARAEARRAVLERYVSPRMVAELDRTSMLDRCVDDATVLFLDLRGFTSRMVEQEHMSLLRELNVLFTGLVDVVFEHDGTVDKLLGDGLLAAFGLFDGEPPNAADRALTAARAMLAATSHFNDDMTPVHPYAVQIGIATGPVHVGHVGGSGFYDLTVIGTCVNLAARLVGCARDAGVDIALDAATVERLASGRVRLQDLGKVEVLGFPDAVQVYGDRQDFRNRSSGARCAGGP